MYEVEAATTLSTLQTANPAVFTPATLDKIITLSTTDNTTVSFEIVSPDASGNVTVPGGAEVVLINSSATTQTAITPPIGAPVLIFQGQGGVNVNLNDTSISGSPAGSTDRVVVGTAGNDRFAILDGQNTLLTLGSGDSTVVGGRGADTIVAGLGDSTIVGGAGHSIVQMSGSADDYTVTVENGHAIVSGGAHGTTTDISKLQFVQLDNGEALVFASDTLEAAVTSIYHAAFGRTADANGLEYWFEAARSGLSLSYIASRFAAHEEFNEERAMTDEQFVQNLYHNTFDRDGEAAGVAYWTDLLTQGTARSELVAAFGLTAAQHFEGTLNVEATVVGDVTIIANIV